MAARTWTPEQRQRQREAIERWRPWEKSTGPKSQEGKARISRNAWTGGEWLKLRHAIKALNRALREQQEALDGRG
jgi:hypothetical protein